MKWVPKVVIVVFVLLIVAQAGKKYVLDEIDFPLIAQATSETGIPVYYRGETLKTGNGLYHPPLYIYSLALFVKLFGFSENSVRAFGMLCVLLTAYIVILIYNTLQPDDDKKRGVFELSFLSLFLLHPYTIANATLPDIDQTVLPITIVLFVYGLLKLFMSSAPSLTGVGKAKKELLIMSGLFALTLWAKLTTPLALPFFAGALFIVFGFGFRRSFLFAAAISLIGSLVFVASFWAYCLLVKLPVSFTFDFLLQSFTKGTAGSEGVVRKILFNLYSAKYFVFWLVIPFVTLFLVSLFSLVKKTREVPTRTAIVISLIFVTVTVFYLCLIAPFGGFFKYPFAVFSLAPFFIAFFISERIDMEKNVNKWVFMMGAALSFILESHFYGDIFFKNGVADDFVARVTNARIVVMVLAAMAISALLRKFRHAKITEIALVLFLATVVGFNLGISRVQAIADYPTKYYYGQRGFDETVSYLRTETSDSEAIWSMKDIGYYVHNRYFENYGYFFRDSLLEELADMMKKGNVRYYVVTTQIGQDRVDAYPKIAAVLDRYGKEEKRFGNFIIYRARGNK